MKKIISLLAFVLFVGCSTQETALIENEEQLKPADQKNKNEPRKDSDGNYVLEEVGQKSTDENGTTAELLNIKKVNEVVDLEPIKLTIKDIKIIQLTTIAPQFKETLELVADRKLGDTVNYIQISYETENTVDENINFGVFDKVVLDTKEQISVGGIAVFSEGTDYEYLGKVKQEGALRVIIKSDPNEVGNIKLVTDYVVDSQSFDTVKEEQIVEYSLK